MNRDRVGMRTAVFIETTIPSYYVARRPRDVVQAARQALTIRWWDHHRHEYELLSSQVVMDEVALGDGDLAEKRVALMSEVSLLTLGDSVERIASSLVGEGIVPRKVADDAVHIACAAAHEVDFLLTWNCTHIANPHIRQRIRGCLARHGVGMPVICTPEEFIGDDYESED